jgi:hypothetical protein
MHMHLVLTVAFVLLSTVYTAPIALPQQDGQVADSVAMVKREP